MRQSVVTINQHSPIHCVGVLQWSGSLIGRGIKRRSGSNLHLEINKTPNDKDKDENLWEIRLEWNNNKAF
jgi:hypothetical protein